MDQELVSGVVTFRYTRDNIELLLIVNGDKSTHPMGQILEEDFTEKETLKNYYDETGLSLLVSSLEPIFEKNQVVTVNNKSINRTVIYYAGIIDSTQDVLLYDQSSEYVWIDHLGGRNSLTDEDDIEAYENARMWLYEHDEAALFLANNVRKLY